MSSYPPYSRTVPPPPPLPRRRGIPWWGWFLIAIGAFVVLMCGGGIAFILYIGSVGPDTKIYTGGEVPVKFLDIARQLGVVKDGEQVLFFYSDGLTDIRDGIYVVTDQKVGIYLKDAAQPLQLVPYEKIRDAVLSRSSTWLEDGSITLELPDDSIVSIPVSNELDRDVRAFEAIQKRMTRSNK